VGAIYDEFLREMAAVHRRFAGRPRDEMLHLFFLTLEREEIVAVAYRESLIAARLAAMPLPDDVRDLIRHALVWAWKDEEMHSIYIRGAILKLGNRLLRWQAFLRQTAGAVGGWATSVQQHVRWTDNPLSRTLSSLVAAAGRVVGSLPADVARGLRYGPFRDFCLFNVDAERTANVGWARLVELAEQLGELPPETIGDFRRVRDDEERHGRVFALLARSLDEHDCLAPGVTARSLAEQLREIGPFFLPRSLRGLRDADNPLGSGGTVWVEHGRSPADKLPCFRRLLDAAGLADRLVERARTLNKAVSDLRVVVKASFMLGYDRRDLSHVTDPELVRELGAWLAGHGVRDVAVGEARNIYDRFFRNRTVRDVARYFGYESPHFRVADFSEDQVPHAFDRGVAQSSVARDWKEADFRITFGKMKSHPVELAHLTVANLEALGARCEEFLFAERQAHRDTGVMMTISDFPPHFALLDAYDAAADGLAGMMGCGRPKVPRRLYAGADALAVDAVAARHLGIAAPRSSLILRAACHWFGDPTGRVRVGGEDRPLPRWRGPFHTEASTLLSFLAYPVYQHGSGRGALFVPAMDRTAFPPVAKESTLLRLGRRAMQELLGLPHGRRGLRGRV
jgi:uncharacterized protein (DUF362 family)